MKKYIALTFSLILVFTLSACGRKNDANPNDMTIMPDTMPTLGTNIPDPDIDTKMPLYTDGTDTDIFDPTTHTDGQTRNGF